MNDIGVTNKRVTAKQPDKPAYSGLEKIEPIISFEHPETVSKLNEVIEKVNLIMEVMKEKK